MLTGGTIIDGAAVGQILTEELTTLKAVITNNIRAAGEWASGRTAASMEVHVTGMSGTLTGRRAFGTLETGRRPGRIPRNMRDIIYEWMQHKGLHGEPMPYVTKGPHKYPNAQVRGDMSMAGAIAHTIRGDMSMAGAIAHTIRTQGTRLYREGGRADIYSQAIPEAVAKINARLGGIFAAVVDEQIKLHT